MELFATVAEAAKEAAKATEVAIEFGKLNDGVSFEQMNFGKLEIDNPQKEISFGSLTDGAFKHNENYLQWQDGIDPGELSKKWIEELTNEISSIYGIYDVDVSKKIWERHKYIITRFYNAAMCFGGDEKHLLFDPKFLRDSGNMHGIDNVLGTLAHEVGHKVYYNSGLFESLYMRFEDKNEKAMLEELFKDVPDITPERKLQGVNRSFYLNEACADYIAGLTARLCKFDPQHQISWYESQPELCYDGEHPGNDVRIEAFMRGYNRIDKGMEAVDLKVFEEFSPYDRTIGVYKNTDTLRKILEEDIINPILNREIKII